MPIYGAFCLFLVAIVLAQVLFGTKSGLAAALASQIAVHYFTIPPKNSFARAQRAGYRVPRRSLP